MSRSRVASIAAATLLATFTGGCSSSHATARQTASAFARGRTAGEGLHLGDALGGATGARLLGEGARRDDDGR